MKEVGHIKLCEVLVDGDAMILKHACNMSEIGNSFLINTVCNINKVNSFHLKSLQHEQSYDHQ